MAEHSFEVAPNVDIKKLSLSHEEGVAVARMIGRRVTVGELVLEGAMTAPRATAILEGLVQKGAVVRVSSGPSAAPRAPAPTASPRSAAGPAASADASSPYGGIVFSAADLAEPAELSEDQKKRILFVEMHLTKWSHYKLLGIKRTADDKEIKAGYFKASKEFHPDAYFRKNLGSYQDRVDRIFRVVKGAYDVLTDPVKRDAYDKTPVLGLTPEEEFELEKRFEQKRLEAEAKERDARNEQRQKDARLKRNPITDRLLRAREMMKLADEAKIKGKIEEAAKHARMAATYDESLKPRAAVLILEADRQRSVSQMKRVHQMLESPMDLKEHQEEITRIAEEVGEIALQTRDAALLIEAARALTTLKRPSRAAKLAQTATDIDGKNARGWEVLAEAANADSKWAILLKASDRWATLEPKAVRAKELHQKAKRETS
jgi:curved DNA-binding protein CbpA